LARAGQRQNARVSRPARICTGREHANVRIPTRDHRAEAARTYNLYRVAEGAQLGAGGFGDTRLDAQHAGPVRMWPERVDNGFRCETRRLDRLLGIHAEHKHVEDYLKICLTLIIAAGTPYCSDRLTAFADQVADKSGARALAWRKCIRMPVHEIKHLAPCAERAAKLRTENRLAEDAAARCQRDHATLTIDTRDVGGAVLRVSRRWDRRCGPSVRSLDRRLPGAPGHLAGWRRLRHRAVRADESSALPQIDR
jgi:hypothetical protein